MTLPILLAAAEAATPGIPETFGLEVKVVIIQIIGFLVLASVLYWFAIKPILATMGTRVSKIESGLKYAEEMKAKLEAAQSAYDAKLKEAQVKSQQIVAETQKSSKEFAEKQQKEAVDQSAAMIAKALATIELEKAKMLAEARTEIARLVVVTTERVLAKKLSDADRSAYNDAASRELTSV